MEPLVQSIQTHDVLLGFILNHRPLKYKCLVEMIKQIRPNVSYGGEEHFKCLERLYCEMPEFCVFFCIILQNWTKIQNVNVVWGHNN
jgi:hypothetical protein